MDNQKVVALAVGGLVVAGLVAFGVYMIDIDQTQEAKLPDVDVKVEGGQAPKFDAKVGTVEVGEKTITVPTLEVKSPEEKAAEKPADDATPAPAQ